MLNLDCFNCRYLGEPECCVPIGSDLDAEIDLFYTEIIDQARTLCPEITINLVCDKYERDD